MPVKRGVNLVKAGGKKCDLRPRFPHVFHILALFKILRIVIQPERRILPKLGNPLIVLAREII